ncbi:MAG: hypothetical protein RL459_327 [Pseudomonadota bacterium]|jgi:hypothetical protein
MAIQTCAAPATVKQTSRKAQLSSHSHWACRTSAWEGFERGSASPDTGQQGGCLRHQGDAATDTSKHWRGSR